MKVAFQAAIAANPMDGDTRKVFADWLEENGFDDEAAIQRRWSPVKHTWAENHMQQFAEGCSFWGDEEDLTDFSIAMIIAAANKWIDESEGLTLGMTGCPDADEEFWDAFEILTGRPVPSDSRENFISCSC